MTPTITLLHLSVPVVIGPLSAKGVISTQRPASAAIRLDHLASDAASVVTEDACSVAMREPTPTRIYQSSNQNLLLILSVIPGELRLNGRKQH